MNTHIVRDAWGWGFVLWLIGYALGVMLFAVVPVRLIGWMILPVGTVLAVWVAFREVRSTTFRRYGLVALVWTLIAALGDYIFIVRALKPADGYYKLDVYLYYALTLAIPLVAGWRKTLRHAPRG